MKKISEYINNEMLFENENCEYKFRLNRKNIEGWVKTIVAFANDRGGTMFIGVNNEGIAVGMSFLEVDDEKNYLNNIIHNKIAPLIDFKITEIRIDENNFIIRIDVPANKDVVVYKDNDNGVVRERIYRRYSGSTYELTGIADITNYVIRKNQIAYDKIKTDYKANNYTFNILNDKYQERLNTTDNLSLKQLISAGLITEDGYLTIAGTLFVDKSPTEFPLIHLRKWPGKDKGSDNVIDAKEYKLNLISQLDKAEKFVRDNSKTGILKGPGGATNVWSFPATAITEAIINALAHRDYNIKGVQIDIDIFTDRIEIASPGDFLPEGDAESYDSITEIPSDRRNEAICNTFALCNLMQRYGSGFDKIAKAYDVYGDKFKPKVFSKMNWFKIILMDITYKEYNEQFIIKEIKLPKKQQIVYNAIFENPGVKISTIESITSLSNDSINNAIRALKDKSLVIYRGSKKVGGYYTVK